MTQQNPSAPDPRIGLVVDDRFRIVALLGTGGMATVYRAEHVRTSAPVAIKVLHRELSSHPEMSARFQREALAARTVQHPNVVSAMDFGRLDDGSLYLVLEYIQGEDLVERLHRVGALPASRAVHIALQVTEALVAAHAAGVVHRDLKPDNIMLVERDGDPDVAKVVDFGIAKLAMPSGKGQALTALGSVFGTPDYMAPEQARGTTVDHRADLYTLGVVIYEMLSGHTPFPSEDPTEILIAQITKAPPPMPEQIDPELRALVMQLLAKDPNGRIQTAAELADRLRRIKARLGGAGAAPAQSLGAPAAPGFPAAYAGAAPSFAAPQAAPAHGASPMPPPHPHQRAHPPPHPHGSAAALQASAPLPAKASAPWLPEAAPPGYPGQAAEQKPSGSSGGKALALILVIVAGVALVVVAVFLLLSGP